MLTKRETDAQKRQERPKLRAKMHNKELTREGLSLDSGGGGSPLMRNLWKNQDP